MDLRYALSVPLEEARRPEVTSPVHTCNALSEFDGPKRKRTCGVLFEGLALSQNLRDVTQLRWLLRTRKKGTAGSTSFLFWLPSAEVLK